MEDELHNLERELETLRPRPLSAGARASLVRRLRAPTPGRATPLPARHGPVLHRIAAALVIVVGLTAVTWMANQQPGVAPVAPNPVARLRTPAPEAPPATLSTSKSARVWHAVPVSVDRQVVSLRDDGAIVHPDQGPVRKVRCFYVDKETWKDNDREVAWSRTQPREEVKLVPMDVY